MAQTPPLGGGQMGGPFPHPSIGVAPLSAYNQQGMLNSGHQRNASTTSSSESLNRGRFEGKVVVVTGGGQGIGSVTVKAFAREGARVVIADIDPEAGGELAESLVQIPSYGDRVMFVQTDVSDENSVQNLFHAVRSRWQVVNILVNNAGLFEECSIFDEKAIETFDKIIGINLRGAFVCSKYAAEIMRQEGVQHGCIVNISSTRSFMSETNTEGYSASKGGMSSLTHALAMSLAPDIRVNSVSPGWIEVSQYKKRNQVVPSSITEAQERQHPVGRVGRPSDVASAVMFLASSESQFITGQDIVCDGGMVKKMMYE